MEHKYLNKANMDIDSCHQEEVKGTAAKRRRRLRSQEGKEALKEEEQTLQESGPEEMDEELEENEEILQDSSAEETDEESGEDEQTERSHFDSHFACELPEGLPTDKMQYSAPLYHEHPEVGPMVHFGTHLGPSPSPSSPGAQGSSLSHMGLKSNLAEGAGELSALQVSFLELLLPYTDVSFMRRTYRKGEALRKVWVLHLVNHILVSRARVLRHNAKLARDPDAEFRDQGFTRPRCLVLVPFRNDCHRMVHCVTQLLGERCTVSNRKRFEREFGPPPKRRKMKKKPLDHEQTFEGNTDEDFKIGLSIKNRSVSLYSDFYRSDLIVASPLGLRQVLGGEGEEGSAADFLSSVEVLVVERAEVLLLQNVLHLLHVLRRINLLPRQSHGCDFSRVRPYACDGLARLFRQTVVLSSVPSRWAEGVLPRELSANHAGYAVSAPLRRPASLAMERVFVTLRMVFRVFDFDDPAKEFDARFRHFVDVVLPEFSSSDMAQTLVFIPSYFDFVRIRNHLRESEASVTTICEYSGAGKVAEARNNFFKGRRHFLLYTERAHFYHRYRIKGAQHLLFYQLPALPASWRDLQVALADGAPHRRHHPRSCTVLASALDAHPLADAVGAARAQHMLTKGGVFVQQVVR